MKGFVSDHFELILGIIVAAVFAFQAFRVLKKAKKIDEQGIATDAVISRIEEIYDPDTASSSYVTYARYRDENHELRETPMSLDAYVQYAEGTKVKIRYIPGDHELVRIADK